MNDIDERRWSERIRRGDFMAIPVPFTWAQSVKQLTYQPLVPGHAETVSGGGVQKLAHVGDKNAIDCTNDDGQPSLSCENRPDSFPVPPSAINFFITQSISENTKRAYRADLSHYEAWGGTIPSSPEMVAAYLAEHAESHTPATLARRIASLSKVHNARGLPNPTSAEIVKATLRGIRRTFGTAQRQAKALLRDDLFALLDKLGDRPKDIRDRAMILVGFVTAVRRSELVALNVEDVEFIAKGALVTIRRSKTDQEGQGRKIAVPHGRTRHCPIIALKAWLTFSGIVAGSIFLAINKHGHVLGQRISGEAVSDVIKTRIEAAGYDPAPFSGHSLRSGFATAAAQAGASTHKIRQTTGHKTEASLARYIRDVDLFDDVAAARVL